MELIRGNFDTSLKSKAGRYCNISTFILCGFFILFYIIAANSAEVQEFIEESSMSTLLWIFVPLIVIWGFIYIIFAKAAGVFKKAESCNFVSLNSDTVIMQCINLNTNNIIKFPNPRLANISKVEISLSEIKGVFIQTEQLDFMDSTFATYKNVIIHKKAGETYTVWGILNPENIVSALKERIKNAQTDN